jgi:hypothetical protein
VRSESTGSKIMFSSSLCARTPLLERFWFPKSLEYWLRPSLVYCNTKDNPLQTNGFPIKLSRAAVLRVDECPGLPFYESTSELIG